MMMSLEAFALIFCTSNIGDTVLISFIITPSHVPTSMNTPTIFILNKGASCPSKANILSSIMNSVRAVLLANSWVQLMPLPEVLPMSLTDSILSIFCFFCQDE